MDQSDRDRRREHPIRRKADHLWILVESYNYVKERILKTHERILRS